MKRLVTISTLLSATGFCFLVVIWPVSYHLNLLRELGSGKLMPSDSVPIMSGYRLGFQDGGVWFYNYDMPYRGGIIAMTSTNDPPPAVWFWHLGDYGIGHFTDFTGRGTVSERSCDFPGIYFRDISSSDQPPPAYLTLAVSLWYPILLLAVLPALWFYRRGHLWFRKP